jgi:uncharacterized Fe-S center protein
VTAVALEFETKSDRLPAGKHIATVAEIEAAFVTAFPKSETRAVVFRQWRLLCEAIERIIPIKQQWLYGSFVTKKENPADVDLVSHFDGELMDGLDPVDKMLVHGLISGHYTRDLHGVDSFAIVHYPERHPAREEYVKAINFWEDMLAHQGRLGEAKGYVEVKRDG